MAGTQACRGPRTLVKENKTTEAKVPDTPAPAQQGETATMNLGLTVTWESTSLVNGLEYELKTTPRLKFILNQT